MGEYINSLQARFDRSYTSCGVLEVHHLPKGDRRTAYSIANTLYHKANPRPVAFIVFSDIVNEKKDERTRGQALAAYIENLKCGTLLAAEPSVNPRTGNMINVWVFRPDHEKFRKWYTEETMHRLDTE